MRKCFKNVMVGAVCIVLTVSLLNACRKQNSNGNTGDISAAVNALLYTTDSGNQTHIEWLNHELQVTGTSGYAFSGASLDGFQNAAIMDGKLILVPQGEMLKKDYGKIVLIDTTNGTSEEIHIGRVNPTGFAAENGKVVVTSNLNMECWIDLADIATKTVQSISLKDYGLLVTNVILVNGGIYGVAVRDDLESSLLCHIDMQNQSCEEIMPLVDDSAFLGKHGSDVVFTSGDKIIKYHTDSHEFTEQPLTRNDAFNINICEDMVLIAYTNIHDKGYNSLVEARDYDTNAILGETPQTGAVLQLESDGEYVYVLGHDTLYQYQINDGAFTLIKSIPCEKNGYYLGGFYHFAE